MFEPITEFLEKISEDAGALTTALLALALIAGVVIIIGLSIAMMFSDEQSSQRYKHWRTNVIKAVIIAGIAGAILGLVKNVLSDAGWWNKTSF